MSAYFEDIVVGQTVELGSHTFGRDDIVAFARQFDPQPFHLSDEGAAGTLFAGLCASGWQTAAVWLRLLVDHRRREGEMMSWRGERPAVVGPSPGCEKIRWLKPVYVGDTIRYTSTVTDKVPSRSRPTVGLVVTENQGFNQHGALVFAVVGKVFVERRSAG
ncbi:MAG: MaoC family dehydratase [Hyphomicrobiaceae bacterium]